MDSKHPGDSDTCILKPRTAMSPAPLTGVADGSGSHLTPCWLFSKGRDGGWLFSSAFFVWLFSRFALKEQEMAHYCSVGHRFSPGSRPACPWGPPGPHRDHASHSPHGAWLPLGIGVQGPPGSSLELQQHCHEARPRVSHPVPRLG